MTQFVYGNLSSMTLLYVEPMLQHAGHVIKSLLIFPKPTWQNNLSHCAVVSFLLQCIMSKVNDHFHSSNFTPQVKEAWNQSQIFNRKEASFF